MVKIKIKRVHSEAKIPSYSKEGDACMDVYAVGKEENKKFVEYNTGLAFELPENYAILVFPRSSITKRDLIMKNSVGVVDSGYRGELKLRFFKQTPKEKNKVDIYEIGERIGQIMVIPLPEIELEEVEKLNPSSRGDKGFGSTGTH